MGGVKLGVQADYQYHPHIPQYRYIKRKKVKRTSRISSESVSPMRMKSDTCVIFLLPIVFKCSKWLRSKLILDMNYFKKLGVL